mmetsp:Transcript_18625/g.26959  ORF Transcript_18625/g.26959 Transcript_18625/m.26959 type:complete len:133 (-) Transcript_18625:432-830(-)
MKMRMVHDILELCMMGVVHNMFEGVESMDRMSEGLDTGVAHRVVGKSVGETRAGGVNVDVIHTVVGKSAGEVHTVVRINVDVADNVASVSVADMVAGETVGKVHSVEGMNAGVACMCLEMSMDVVRTVVGIN